MISVVSAVIRVHSCSFVVERFSRRGEPDLDRRIWLLRIHDYGLGRLHIHALVFDLPHRLQAKFLRFFRTGPATTDYADVPQNDKTGIRIGKELQRARELAASAPLRRGGQERTHNIGHRGNGLPANHTKPRRKITALSVISV